MMSNLNLLVIQTKGYRIIPIDKHKTTINKAIKDHLKFVETTENNEIAEGNNITAQIYAQTNLIFWAVNSWFLFIIIISSVKIHNWKEV